MKRIGNLYKNIYDFDNIVQAYNEVCKNTKNKRKVAIFRSYKCMYISIHWFLITPLHSLEDKNIPYEDPYCNNGSQFQDGSTLLLSNP